MFEEIDSDHEWSEDLAEYDLEEFDEDEEE